MGISEILELESKNRDITLHKEGLFWRAYEHSAYLFVKQIKEYNLTKKFYKNVNQEVVYLGFPQNSLLKIEAICQKLKLNVTTTNKQVKISGFEGENFEKFSQWKDSIPILSRIDNKNDDGIIEKIKRFNTVNKTPIECQQFIVELQNQING